MNIVTSGNTIKWISLIFIMILNCASCKQKNKHSVSISSQESKQLDEKALLVDSLKICGHPYHFCEQILTSEDAILAADISKVGDYAFDREATPIQETFFFPEKDIKSTTLVKNVQLRYNYVNVLYRILQGYELFIRKSSADSLGTRKDSLDLIVHDCPVIPSSLLQKAIPEKEARKVAEKLLASYQVFDGREDSDSAFDKAHAKYVEEFENLPIIADDVLLEDFEEHFWEWYDKRKYVPEYDQIVALYINDVETETELTDEKDNYLKAVIEGEKDIDRRTILALELIRNSHDSFKDATMYLGEILESGIYTKYILEAWLAWRAGVQLVFFSPSSFCVIPNYYYDKLRIKCMNTILRHIQTGPDKYDVCLMENFIFCEILHRMDAIYGNEAMTIISLLTNGMFIQPSALGKDYLKEE